MIDASHTMKIIMQITISYLISIGILVDSVIYDIQIEVNFIPCNWIWTERLF